MTTPADELRQAAALIRREETDDAFMLAVADWLEVTPSTARGQVANMHALAVARAYLGGAA